MEQQKSSQTYELTVDIEHEGQRLDVFITNSLGGHFSRTYITKLIKSKMVTVNSQHEKANHPVCEWDHVIAQVCDPAPLPAKAENIHIEVVYEDEAIIVINKQPGLVVHPAPGNYTGTLVNALLHHCKNLSGIGGVLRPGIVHRLDKDTTGLLVAAKTDQAHRNLVGQFKNKTAKRIYIALVKGIVQFDNGIIDEPLSRHFTERKKMKVDQEGKEARTRYKVIKRFLDFTELELHLETGRTHQIRVHLAYIGYPVLGDRVYGSMKGLNRQALHAKILKIVHPLTQVPMTFEVDLPNDIEEVIQREKM